MKRTLRDEAKAAKAAKAAPGEMKKAKKATKTTTKKKMMMKKKKKKDRQKKEGFKTKGGSKNGGKGGKEGAAGAEGAINPSKFSPTNMFKHAARGQWTREEEAREEEAREEALSKLDPWDEKVRHVLMYEPTTVIAFVLCLVFMQGMRRGVTRAYV